MVEPVSGNLAAAYVAQQPLVRNQERIQEDPSQEVIPPANETSRGERVTISPEAQQLARQANEAGTSQEPTEQAGSPQAAERTQSEQAESTQAAVAKTVAQAINTYHNNSVTNNLG